MSFLRTHKFYTEEQIPQLEHLLEHSLSIIAEEIRALHLQKLAAVYLGGGYGRGEGGAFLKKDGTYALYNDLDFFVFTKSSSAKERETVDTALQRISGKWTHELNMDVDFGPAKDIRTLKRVGDTLMYQELKHGYVMLPFGEHVLENFSGIPIETLPLIEGFRLLVNRGMGLLFAAEKLMIQSEETDFISRNLNKTILGTADAILIQEKAYQWRVIDRFLEFQKTVLEKNWDKSLIVLTQDALEFKFIPKARDPKSDIELWGKVRDFWLKAVCCYAGIPENATTGELHQALHRQKALHRGHRLKSALRWTLKTHSFSPGYELFDDPLVKVMGDLFELIGHLQFDGSQGIPQDIRNRLWRCWLMFN